MHNIFIFVFYYSDIFFLFKEYFIIILRGTRVNSMLTTYETTHRHHTHTKLSNKPLTLITNMKNTYLSSNFHFTQ